MKRITMSVSVSTALLFCSTACGGVRPDSSEPEKCLENSFASSLWGPERAVFTMESPAGYAVFNSITDNPTIGDERNFVKIGQVNPDETVLGDEVEIIPGHQYLVYIYFHNNASSTLNDAAHDHAGVAVGTRISSAFPSSLASDGRGVVTATITSENTDPVSVWDGAYITTISKNVRLRYVSGSARIYHDWEKNSSVLPDSLFTEGGTLLGLNDLNGVIPGCEEYHGVVTYVLEAE